MQTMGAAAVVPFVTGRELEAETGGAGHVAGAVFELRTYHCFEGKLPLLLERFRSKETKIFARMGMHGVGYWTPTDEPLAGKTLVYLLRHKSREAATASWRSSRMMRSG